MDLAAVGWLRQPVDLLIGGLVYTVEPATVPAWLGSITEGVPLLALLEEGQAKRLSARLWDVDDDDVDHDVLHAAWREALAVHTGLPWWVAERLLGALVTDWHRIAGLLLLKRIDAHDAPVDAVLSALLALMEQGSDEKERRATHAKLWAPPPEAVEVAAEEPAAELPGFSPEEQAAAWKSAAAATSGLAGART